jgi:hypothetical protein
VPPKSAADGPSTKLAGAAIYGSKEAYSNVVKAWAQMRGSASKKPEEKTAKNTDKMRVGIDKLVKAVADIAQEAKNAEVLGIPG